MSRILALLEHRKNRKLLAEFLSPRYEVLSVDNDSRSIKQLLWEESFDLGIVDGPMLERLRVDIHERRQIEPSVQLPFLLVTSRPRLGLAQFDLWKAVDDLILAPIERVELHARVEILLRARNLSLELEERYFALAANSPVGVAIVQGNRVVYANDELLHLLEARREQLVGTNLLDYLQFTEGSVSYPGTSGRDYEGFPFEVGINRPSGARWAEVRRAALRYHGEPATLYLVADVTARKMAQLEMQRAKREAEQLARLKATILDNLSHEIRTPLTGIIGYAELMAGASLEESEEYSRFIKVSGERLLETLSAVIDLSQLESGNYKAVPHSVDLISEVRKTVGRFQSRIEEQGLEVRVIAPTGEIQLFTDEGILTRILDQLLSNAIKFTQQGSITISIEGTADAVLLHVEDTGVGISREFLPQLFSEFKQESTGLNRNYDGIGLGLVIAKRMVELLGGEIAAQSEKGIGSRFTIRLPRSTEGRTEENPGAPGSDHTKPEGEIQSNTAIGPYLWPSQPQAARGGGIVANM